MAGKLHALERRDPAALDTAIYLNSDLSILREKYRDSAHSPAAGFTSPCAAPLCPDDAPVFTEHARERRVVSPGDRQDTRRPCPHLTRPIHAAGKATCPTGQATRAQVSRRGAI